MTLAISQVGCNWNFLLTGEGIFKELFLLVDRRQNNVSIYSY